MRQAIALAVVGTLMMTTARAAQQSSPAVPEVNRRPAAALRPVGAPQNRWRYQYSDGRWWYWTPENRWSYFDGRHWRLVGNPTGYVRRPVDPALLRLEYKEGVLGRRRWPRIPASAGAGSGGAGALPLSGTQGPLGGAPSGSFTDPGGVPSAINTETGTPTDVSGLNAGGRAVTGSPLSGSGMIGGPGR